MCVYVCVCLCVCVCVCVYVRKACKHDISRTVYGINLIFGILMAHGPRMVPIVFGARQRSLEVKRGQKVKSQKSLLLLGKMLDFHETWK